jgi:outer membrane protein W
LRDYIRKLKLGYQFYAEATGYFNSFVGLGIKANVFKASNTEYGVIASDETGNIVYIGEMSDNTTMLFIAPTFFARVIHGRRENALVMSAGIGYIRYWDKAVFSIPFSLTGNTIGVSYDIGYDFRLNDLLLLGLNSSFTYGILSTVKQTDAIQTTTITLDQSESLFRMDLSVGIRFSKKANRFLR